MIGIDDTDLYRNTIHEFSQAVWRKWKETMEHKSTLGRSSLKVPRMGMGAMTWGSPRGLARLHPAQRAYGPSHGMDEERRALEVSLAAGVNLVDTAAMYSLGAAELRLGELAHNRDVVIGTKFPPGFFSRIESLPRALDATLARLQRSWVDLYQHHYPTTNNNDIPKLMNLMADAFEAGKIKAVGVSNYSAEQMRLAHAALAKRGIPLASNQVEYSLLHRKPEVDGVLDACRELGITLIAYSPLAMGALTGKYTTTNRAGGMRRMFPSFRGKGIEAVQPVVKLLREIGEKYSKTPSQVALRWLIENENVLPIPGAKNGKQASENGGALTFSMTQVEVESLSQATMVWRR